MSLTSANLVGYLRAEFEKASRLRVRLFVLQLLVALPASVAVLMSDDHKDTLYWLAFAGAVLLIAWWLLNGHYARVRKAAQADRRGRRCSAASMSSFRRVKSKLTETLHCERCRSAKSEKEDYYATKLAAGPSRLGEMLEESAFYSEHLQRISANIMGGLLALFAVVFVGIAIAVLALRWARRRIDDCETIPGVPGLCHVRRRNRRVPGTSERHNRNQKHSAPANDCRRGRLSACGCACGIR